MCILIGIGIGLGLFCVAMVIGTALVRKLWGKPQEALNYRKP